MTLLINFLNYLTINFNLFSNFNIFLFSIEFGQVNSLYWFSLSIIFFFVGLIGIIFNNNNFLILLLRIEIMFLGLNMMFIGSSVYYINIDGLIFSLFIFGIIAAESAIGLSLFFISYLNYGTTEIDFSKT